MNVTLPWPDRRLLPNARIHFRQRAQLVKLARDGACILTCSICPLEARKALAMSDRAILLSITFRPPDRRRRDLDGMIASCKATLDGLADGLGVDDYRFELHLRRGETIKGGAVEIAIALC